jgi:rhodanese-related sulfurtransferase
MEHSEAFLKIVEQSRGKIKETSVAETKERIARGDQFHLIDVREDREWDGGRIKGAVHISKGVIERDIEREIEDKNAEIVLYCGGGFRSALAAENLQRMGYLRVASMDGGIRGWVEAGGVVEK